MFKDYSNSRITVRYTRRYSLTFIAPMDILRAVDCVVGNDMPGVYLLAPSVYENWNGSRHPESKNFTTEQISGTGDAMLALVQVFRGLELSKRIPKGVKLTKLDEHQLSESVQAELECKFEPKPIALIKTGYMAKLYETRAIAFNVFEGLINALKHGSAVISVNRTRE